MRNCLFFISIAIFLTSCIQKSVLHREDNQHRKYAVQYCGGQIWGYIQPLDKNLPSNPYIAVYTLLTQIDKEETLLLYVAVNFKKSAQIQFLNSFLKLKINNLNSDNRPLNFVAIEGFKRIDQLFPSDSYVIEPGSKENEYLVSKKKYGGFFGEMNFALEKPIVYTMPKKENLEVKGKSYSVAFDPSIHDEFYILAVPILFLNQVIAGRSYPKVPEKAKIEITLPEIQIDQTKFNLDPFVINFERQKILESANGSHRCPSLEEMFRWSRSSLLPKFIIN